ncbi:MAG: TIGR00282 family metallophosphoesterase [Eubacteriales bacterium]
MKLLVIGDIVGRPGRNIIAERLHHLIDINAIDMVIANGENASGGNGLTEKNATELFQCGINIITMGNHIWDKKEILNYIDTYPNLIRPANYPEPCPGKGYTIFKKGNVRVGVINISGVIYLKNLRCPFETFDILYEKVHQECDMIIVDFHAEATSEKIAMGYYGDGRASLVFGTHTHVQTADVRILENGTGFISDVGMTGPYDGILGIDKHIIIQHLKNKRPVKFELASGQVQINGLIVDINHKNGKCESIQNFIHIFE